MKRFAFAKSTLEPTTVLLEHASLHQRNPSILQPDIIIQAPFVLFSFFFFLIHFDYILRLFSYSKSESDFVCRPCSQNLQILIFFLPHASDNLEHARENTVTSTFWQDDATYKTLSLVKYLPQCSWERQQDFNHEVVDNAWTLHLADIMNDNCSMGYGWRQYFHQTVTMIANSETDGCNIAELRSSIRCRWLRAL